MAAAAATLVGLRLGLRTPIDAGRAAAVANGGGGGEDKDVDVNAAVAKAGEDVALGLFEPVDLLTGRRFLRRLLAARLLLLLGLDWWLPLPPPLPAAAAAGDDLADVTVDGAENFLGDEW